MPNHGMASFALSITSLHVLRRFVSAKERKKIHHHLSIKTLFLSTFSTDDSSVKKKKSKKIITSSELLRRYFFPPFLLTIRLCNKRNEIYHHLSTKILFLCTFSIPICMYIYELLIKQWPPVLLHFSVFKGGFHCTFYQLQPHLFQQLQCDRHCHSSPACFLLYLYCTLYQLQQCLSLTCWLFVVFVLHTTSASVVW